VHEGGDREDQDSFISDEEQHRQDVTGLAASWKPSAPFRLRTGLGREPIPESIEESELTESAESDQTTRPIRSAVIPEQSVTDGDGHYFYNPEESQMSTDQPPDDLHIEVPLDEEEDLESENLDDSQLPLRQALPAPIYQSQTPDQSFR
jgi:hypothetical protein